MLTFSASLKLELIAVPLGLLLPPGSCSNVRMGNSSFGGGLNSLFFDFIVFDDLLKCLKVTAVQIIPLQGDVNKKI